MRLFHGRHRFAARRRVAVSELMGTLIVIAITLIAGAGAWGWVNGQTGTSANQLGQANANNVNYLRESESITLVNFGSNTGTTNALGVYVYNRGAVALTVSGVSISGPTCAIPLGPSGANCGDGNQTVLIVYSATPQTQAGCNGNFCFTPASSACVGTASIGGQTNIAMQSFAPVAISLSGCPFVFATSSSSASPVLLMYSFQVNVQGQFGSSASTVTTR